MDDKIKRYSRIRYTLTIVDFFYLLLILALFQISGLAIRLRAGLYGIFAPEALLILFYCLVIFLFYFILNFPLDFYRSYVVEHRFGLSNERLPHWLGDRLKEFIIGFMIFIILVEGFFYFLRRYPGSWWWISGLFWILFSLVLARIFPVIIIPLFFKYKRITDDDLRQRILNLAKGFGIKLLDVYQIDFSKKTTKANAALVGLGKSKRVILTDTLQNKYNHEEIEVILAHEFAHFRLRHLIKQLTLNAAVILSIFYLLFRFTSRIFGLFNLDSTDIAGLAVWLFCFASLQACLVPLLNWISRNMERNADYLAIKFTGLSEAFVSMLEKLSEQNLAERKPARWIKILFFDHPPVGERIAMVK